MLIEPLKRPNFHVYLINIICVKGESFMLEGEIIKFYRTKAGLTQEELGKGICSSKHVGKIERGKTSYSSEIISLFSERLDIDIQKEISNFECIEKQLTDWHLSIIKLRMKEVDSYKSELEQSPYISSSKYAPIYQLLLARYYILKMDFEKTFDLIQNVQANYHELSPHEQNLLFHVQGIYYLSNYNNSSTEKHHKALEVLKKIDIKAYGNLEYYYHLAVAYAWVDSKVMAYVYAEKSLRYFKESSNFLRAINAESIMLLQIESNINLDFEGMKRTYINLIHDSQALNAPDKTGMLLNNLGFEYFKRNDFERAQKYYKEALQLANKPSVIYLQRFHNYLKSSYEGKLMKKSILLRNVQRGLAMADELENRHYQLLFKLLHLAINDNGEQYFNYIEKTALPYFKSRNHTVLMKRYGKQLYTYYVEIKEYEKAIHISNFLLDDVKRVY